MKAMKKSLSIVLALVMVLSVIVVAPVVADAGSGSWVQMFNVYGTLYDYGDCAYRQFTLSKKTDVEFVMGSYYSEGYYRFNIENEYGTIVYERSGYIDYYDDDHEYYTTLAAGTYYVNIYNNDDTYDESLVYDFYAYRFNSIPTNPTSLKLNKKKITLSKNGTYTLKATYKPSEVSSSLKFTTSNKKVASISYSGKYCYVTAKALGKATITAKMGNKKAKCTVTVNKCWLEIGKGKSKSLTSYVKKVSGYKKAKWSSSKKKFVTVSKKGKIKGKKHGNSKITAKIKGKKYYLTVYSYDKKVIKKKTIANVKDRLYVPSSFKLGTVRYPHFYSCKIYYSAKNLYGSRVYSATTGFYDKGKFYAYDNF